MIIILRTKKKLIEELRKQNEHKKKVEIIHVNL